MPTYEYECQRCGHRFEKFQNMSEELLKECPQCGGELRRLIGKGAGIIFKGSGFYVTDYKKSSQGKTCCGRDEPCDTPPCSDGICKKE
jgi:putative FmdB family regulatory protein